MHAFERGELLIGGMALRQLQGRIEQEEQAVNSRAWLLSGKLRLSSQHGSQLELERQYLLRIDDGREGLVELTRLTPTEGDLEADFRPRAGLRS
ncbi:MAG TPA: hypothetical protein VFE46_05965 [Pirellulales bacterium]|jgi:hypothetical protein|nr:hypothetical protein [Pirellulales bacterium]